MSSNNSSDDNKNFTEMLANKAEKAGEAAGDAVNRLTEMLTSKDNPHAANASDDNLNAANAGKGNANAANTSKSNSKGLINKENFHLTSNNKALEGRCWKVSLFNVLLVMYDIFAVVISYFLALWFRFDGSFSQIPRQYLNPYIMFIPFALITVYNTDRNFMHFLTAMNLPKKISTSFSSTNYHYLF